MVYLHSCVGFDAYKCILQMQFQDLANCLHGGRALRKNKLQKLLCITGVASACDFIANPRRIFQSKNGCPGHPCAREVAAVSKKGLFSGCFAPFVDGALPQLGSPSQQQTRPIFQFTKVESTVSIYAFPLCHDVVLHLYFQKSMIRLQFLN